MENIKMENIKMNLKKKKELSELLKQYKKEKSPKKTIKKRRRIGQNRRRLIENNLKSLEWNYSENGEPVEMLPGVIVSATAQQSFDNSPTKEYRAIIIPFGTTNNIKFLLRVDYKQTGVDNNRFPVINKKFESFQDAILYFRKVTGIKVILKLI